MPASCIVFLNNFLSSARAIASLLAPMSSTPYFSKTPSRAALKATFKAVCPPKVARHASGLSLTIIFSKVSTVIGSI